MLIQLIYYAALPINLSDIWSSVSISFSEEDESVLICCLYSNQISGLTCPCTLDEINMKAAARVLR